jgi:5'-3' exonuclease
MIDGRRGRRRHRHADDAGRSRRHAGIVSTGDKDLAQLVTPHVTLINTMTNETLDEAGVAAKFGVPPERIVDYLTLIGDAVDNVPGVAKVGPKTAVKWLAEFGDPGQPRGARRRDQGRRSATTCAARWTGCRWGAG